jgi:hypothetical protein
VRYSPVKLVPVMVTLVPPAAGPLLGAIDVTVGFSPQPNGSCRLAKAGIR